jgi:hypothetical protein
MRRTHCRRPREGAGLEWVFWRFLQRVSDGVVVCFVLRLPARRVLSLLRADADVDATATASVAALFRMSRMSHSAMPNGRWDGSGVGRDPQAALEAAVRLEIADAVGVAESRGGGALPIVRSLGSGNGRSGCRARLLSNSSEAVM